MIRVTCAKCGGEYQMPAEFHSMSCPHCEEAAEVEAGDDLTPYEQSILDRALDKIEDAL